MYPSLLLFLILTIIATLCTQPDGSIASGQGFRSFLRLRSPDGSVKNARVTFVRQYRRRPLLASPDPLVPRSPFLTAVNQSAINVTTSTTSAPAVVNVTPDFLTAREDRIPINKTASSFANHTSVPVQERSDHVNMTSQNPDVDKLTKRGPLPKYEEEDRVLGAHAVREKTRLGERIMLLHDEESRSISASQVSPDGRSDIHEDMETSDPFDPDTFMLDHVQPPEPVPGPGSTTHDPGRQLSAPPDLKNDQPATNAPETIDDTRKEKPPIILPFPYTMREIKDREKGGHSELSNQELSSSKGPSGVGKAINVQTTIPCPTATVSHVIQESAGHGTSPPVRHSEGDLDLSSPEEDMRAVHQEPGNRHPEGRSKPNSPTAMKPTHRQRVPPPPSHHRQRSPEVTPTYEQKDVGQGIDQMTTSLQEGHSEDDEAVIETTGEPEKLFTSTKPYYFPDLLLSFAPTGESVEKSQAAAKSVEVYPNPNFLSVSSVTISPILRNKVRPLFEPMTPPSVRRGHKDHLFSVELLKEEDALPRPIWYKTHNSDLVEPLDYDYISHVTGEKTLEKDLYGLAEGFRFAS